jgi:hypothetical protein
MGSILPVRWSQQFLFFSNVTHSLLQLTVECIADVPDSFVPKCDVVILASRKELVLSSNGTDVYKRKLKYRTRHTYALPDYRLRHLFVNDK